ncbi:MAG TPA: LacI family transcriptional regulator, partial [Stenotrophomonas sp.]|nr:LacI family transcriptional regulator [Stenotrophomonas sp.]
AGHLLVEKLLALIEGKPVEGESIAVKQVLRDSSLRG